MLHAAAQVPVHCSADIESPGPCIYCAVPALIYKPGMVCKLLERDCPVCGETVLIWHDHVDPDIREVQSWMEVVTGVEVGVVCKMPLAELEWFMEYRQSMWLSGKDRWVKFSFGKCVTDHWSVHIERRPICVASRGSSAKDVQGFGLRRRWML